MTKEIERKWLPSCHFTTDSLKYHATKVERIRQRYFHEDNPDKTVARVRQYFSVVESKTYNALQYTITRSELTTKCGMGVERGEHNVPICDDLASYIMYPDADVIVIEKTRYTIPFEEQGVDIEVDVYDDLNKGLIHIEVEFPNRIAADKFKKLHWFGEEVTDDPRHTNAALQETPYTWWKK